MSKNKYVIEIIILITSYSILVPAAIMSEQKDYPEFFFALLVLLLVALYFFIDCLLDNNSKFPRG